ncbi:hypothetical protein J6590_045083 [Homalodisca vitripennis]|nr:hypothetical protein J6590_045083 [Homalodisca vitripennis]
MSGDIGVVTSDTPLKVPITTSSLTKFSTMIHQWSSLLVNRAINVADNYGHKDLEQTRKEFVVRAQVLHLQGGIDEKSSVIKR